MSIFTAKSATGHDIPAIHAGGQVRLLAALPKPMDLRGAFAAFSSANPVISRSQWRPSGRPRPGVPILDQGHEGACSAHGAATALMLARDISGATFQLLSAPFLYSLNNHGVDQGSNPGDIAVTLQTTGVCLMQEFPEGNYLANRIPRSAYQTAARFKAAQVYRCVNFDEMVSAWMLGFTLFDSVLVGPDFNSLDQYGVPPVSMGPANHCTAIGDSLKQLPDGSYVLEHRNSWTPGWGVDGRFWMSEAHVLAQGQWYECYAITTPTEDPQDPLTPPTP